MKIGKLHVLDKCRVCGVDVQPLRLRLCDACEDRAVAAYRGAQGVEGAELRRLWEALASPYADTLSLVLGGVQKDGYPSGYADWRDFVTDVMQAMELHDAGAFPDDWLEDHQGDIARA